MDDDTYVSLFEKIVISAWKKHKSEAIVLVW